MYVKIHSSKKDNNRGSCNSLINYLEKENLEKDLLSQTKFFDQSSKVRIEIKNNKNILKISFLTLNIDLQGWKENQLLSFQWEKLTSTKNT